MLRRKEDMKEWQREALLKGEKIVGKKAPDALMYDDAPEIPEEAIPEVHEDPVLEIPKEEKPVKKTTARKKTTK